MSKALYRTYRSKKLSEIVGQEHITTALEHALQKGTISHAYLFTGPRGVGKTSIARILAHDINQLPYTDDATHLDIIEIDAASNRRIDEIRDLRDKVHIAPTSAKYKVYIIDEVHMLTREAFNALLKTLEEPPAHVIFILATTEVHKLPETIVSRTQRFAFKPVELKKVVTHLRDIAKKEKINVDDAALELIARHGEGSFRDSISLLDQIRNQDKPVTLQTVQDALGIAPEEMIADTLQALGAHDVVAIATQLQHTQTRGYEPAQVAKQLGQVLRQMLVDGKPPTAASITLKLLAQLVEVPASADPRTTLELALLDAALAGAPSATAKPAAAGKVMPEEVQTKPASITAKHPSTFKKAAAVAGQQPATATISEPKQPAPAQPAEASATEAPAQGETPAAPMSTIVLDAQVWPQILATIKQKYNTLYSIARAARPHFEPGKVTLESSFAFHQKRLNEQRNKELIAQCIQQLTGEAVQVSCIVGQRNTQADLPPAPLPPADDEQVHAVAAPAGAPAQPAVAQPTTGAVAAISNIFGSAEVLES